MHVDGLMQTTARELFENEFLARHKPNTGSRALDALPALRVVEELLELVDKSPFAPPPNLESIVRRRIMDENFAGEGGDAVVDPLHRMPLEEEVRLVVTVLEQAGARLADTDRMTTHRHRARISRTVTPN